jgi:hypothetical protein
MAFTIDKNNLVSLGSAHLITGSYTTVTGGGGGAEAILPGSTIISFWLNYNETDDDLVIPRIHINASDFSGTAAAGSIFHLDSTNGDEVSFTVIYK